MKKAIWGLSIFLLMPNLINAQTSTDYDKAMIALANQVAQRVKDKQKRNIIVWRFLDTKKNTTAIGKYIREDFGIHFIDVSDQFTVLDRNDVKEQLMEEHELVDQGFIDMESVKRLGVLLSADAIVTGTVDVGLHSLRVRVKLIDTETGRSIAGIIKNIPIDTNMRYILDGSGINKEKNIDKKKKRTQSNEKYENPNSTSLNCETLQTGDYCFENKTSIVYLVDVRNMNDSSFRKSISVNANSKKCLLGLPFGTYEFSLYMNNLRTVGGSSQKGNFRVEKCKSITYKIKPLKKRNIVNDFYDAIKKKNKE